MKGALGRSALGLIVLIIISFMAQPGANVRGSPAVSHPGGPEEVHHLIPNSSFSWSQLSPPLSPSPRNGAIMAYDTADGYIVLFGGCCENGGNLNDTWLFKGGHWALLPSAGGPSGESHGGLAYDAKDGYLVLYGGEEDLGYTSGFTSVFHGTTWRSVNGPGAPGPESAMGMTYDGSSGEVVMFGGLGSTGLSWDDTAKYTGGNWSWSEAIPHPPGREYTGLAYDTLTSTDILFGGSNTSQSQPFGDTWSLQAGSWTELSPDIAPSPRDGPAMAYDAEDGYLLLFGGFGAGGYLSDTWSFGPSGGSVPSLSSVGVSPASAELNPGGTKPFSAASVCTGGSCGSGITYSWSLSSELGTLNSTTGATVLFTAGPLAGQATLVVTVTLNGKSETASALLTISEAGGTSSSPTAGGSSSPNLLGWGIMIGGLLTVVLGVTIFLVVRSRKRHSPYLPQGG